MKNLNISPYTMVFMVGPSCCGKSRMASWISKQMQMSGWKSIVISSDDCRRDLILNAGMDNMHPQMMTVSAQAFEMLELKARLHMSFPVNTPFVFIDSTGLDHEMRKKFNIMAKDHGYNSVMIVFDLEREELMANVAERGGLEHVTGRHMKTLREKVMPALDRKYWDEIIIVKSHEEALHISQSFVIDSELHDRCLFTEDQNFAVIGDVHEQVEELDRLIEQLPKDISLYFIGDMFDKGHNTFAMIDYMENLKSNRKVIELKGNHENYITRRLKGQIDPNPEIEAAYMTAVKPLLENEEYRNRYLALDAGMLPYARILREKQRDVYLTHAPVKKKYIGKTSKYALKAQINFRFETRDIETMQDELAFIKEESNRSHPWHVFGHVAHDEGKPFYQNNKVWLDTGCVHGNKLSAVIFEGDRVNSISVKSSKERDPKIFTFKRAFNIEDLLQSEVRLSDEEEQTVRRVTKGGAKFISGTMSPAPSVPSELNIESLQKGLEYFASMGVRNLVLQPKFMGSRCQVYLYKDRPEECFATSRNGFKIRFSEVKEYVQSLLPIFQSKIEFDDELIMDGELLPWAALGRGLIDKEFGYYAVSLENEIITLKEDRVLAGLENVGVDLLAKNRHLFDFEVQLFKFGSEGPLKFEPFSTLSVDGKCRMRDSQFEAFNTLNDRECIMIDPTSESGRQRAAEYFKTLTFTEGFEGLVAKPDKFMPDVLPYMKVRNTEYLRLIYGYDYPDRLERLCAQKSIQKKAKVALKEFQMGLAMLEMPEHREKLISAFFGQIKIEKDLDPRL